MSKWSEETVTTDDKQEVEEGSQTSKFERSFADQVQLTYGWRSCFKLIHINTFRGC